MSANVTEFGYLERPYLVDAYAVSTATYGHPSQVQLAIGASKNVSGQVSFSILNFPRATTSQVSLQTSNTRAVNAQATLGISSGKNLGSQANLQTSEIKIVNDQVQLKTSGVQEVKGQTNLSIDKSKNFSSQFDRRNTDSSKVEAQASLKITNALNTKYTEFSIGTVVQEICGEGGYLTGPYLVDAYLTRQICTQLFSQVTLMTTHSQDVASQVSRSLTDKVSFLNSQTLRGINKSNSFGSQFDRVQTKTFGSQVLKALYNATNIRVLYNFPSRGSDGLNWTANSTLAGDFSVNNLNTDIVEQQWRSAAGVKTGITLSCDTDISQGIFMDTLAVLNHNLTRSATVSLQASNDAGFSTIGLTENLTVIDDPNIYYIAPILPTSSFRYWRFIINDSTNTASNIQIGTIIFGSSVILQGDNITDDVSRDTVHFSDKVQTEGYTNASNDRAIKYSVGVEFKFLDYEKGNYKSLVKAFKTIRTSLKALWIPDPKNPERFAVFGKLVKIPTERHKVISASADYVAFNVDIDESL